MKICLIVKLFFCFMKLLAACAMAVFGAGCAVLELILPKRRDGNARKGLQKSSRRDFLEKLYGEFSRAEGRFESKDTIALLKYKDPVIRRLIWDFKYYMKPYSTKFCAGILYDELIASMSDRVSMLPFSNNSSAAAYLLTHCPSSTFFKGEKKFDHMKELLIKVETYLNPTAPFFVICTHAILPNQAKAHVAGVDALSNTSESKAQHLGNRKERLAWARDRFSLSEEFIKFIDDARPYHIYCIDDVTTTGASFGAVRSLLEKRTNSPVRCIALAH